VRLFCFPYAGGGATAFRGWQEHLTPDVEVCAVQLPGRETRIKEAPVAQLSSLLRLLAPALLPHLDRPFAFFGHSLGALLSFELTRRLRREYAVEPLHLFLSGRGAPQIRDDRPMIHALPEPQFREELRALNGTPEGVLEHEELLRLVIPIIRADFAICETYQYTVEPPLNCSISAFGGLQDRDVSIEQLEAWRLQTNASFTLRMFPGDHFFVHQARPSLLDALNQELNLLARKAA
jgi:medium-chain acyl-[acyl-carrier-protein] hydrolase